MPLFNKQVFQTLFERNADLIKFIQWKIIIDTSQDPLPISAKYCKGNFPGIFYLVSKNHN